MQSKARDLQGFVVLLLALVGGGFLLFRNVQPPQSYSIGGSTVTTTAVSSWQDVVDQQLGNGPTLLPTREVPVVNVEPPTLPPVTGTPVLLEPSQIPRTVVPTEPRTMPITPTRPGPTPVPSPTSQVTVVANNRPSQGQFSPPPEQVPLSMDPHDHFWFTRPVDA